MQNLDLKNKTVFITGVAGFIGSNLAERLLKEIEGIKIVGLDNMNDYYDVRLKEYRLEKLSSSGAFPLLKEIWQIRKLSIQFLRNINQD